MGLFDKKKRQLDIKAVSSYEYDAIATPDRHEGLRDKFTRSMLINSVWYAGNDIELKQLYQRDLPAFKISPITSDEMNYFWARPSEDNNFRKVHTGLPQLISETMVDLLLSNGYEFNVYQDDEETDRDEDNQTRLENILNYNNFDLLHPEAVETESWSGGVAFKISSNKRYKWPILEVIQPEEYEARIEAGRIVEDIFIKYFNKNNDIFKLKEFYGVDDNGGYIRYELYRKTNTDDWVDASLGELEQTKDLKDISFKGIYEKFSLYKPNKLPNSEFRGSRLGESDYSGSHGMFDALDEIYSTMIQEFRDAKIKNFWPSALLPLDPTTQQVYMPTGFKKDFVVYESGIGEKEKPSRPEIVQGEIYSDKYIEAFKKSIEVICNNAGLSPQTLGVTGLESVSASEESQELREKKSVRTREKKVNIWQPSMEQLFRLLLMMDDIRQDRKPNDYHVRVIFNDYKIQTLKDKTEIARNGLESGSWDLKTAINYIHDDMTDEEQILTRVNVKIEKGINVFTKEEELIYRKFVADVTEELGEVEQEVTEFVETESIEPIDEEVVEDID